MSKLEALLKPLKAIILGPPASGKTTLAERICKRYGAHYVSPKSMINETIEELQYKINKELEKQKKKRETKQYAGELDEEDETPSEQEDENDEDMVKDIEVWQEQLRDITQAISKSEDGKLTDDYLIRLMRSFLAKDVCQTRGYVLDGFPKTLQQAKELFGQATEVQTKEEVPRGAGEDDTGRDRVGTLIGNASDILLPDFVISLEAADSFLCERVMNLPQKDIQGTHWDEANMVRRLLEYRSNNTISNTVLRFFDESNIHPILIDLIDEETEKEKDFYDILDFLYEIFGEPIPGFGITAEEEERLRQLEIEAEKLRIEAAKIEKQILEEKMLKEREENLERWTDTFQKLQKEEEKLLAAQSEPLRFYLLRYVFPILCKGLVEVVKIKPDDPIDFLAEFLFKENPEGKMFDPSYTQNGELIVTEVEDNLPPDVDRDDYNGGENE